MNTYFTADTHFQHGLTTREFASVEEHDDVLMDAINQTVGENDRLFHLGDFAWRAEESYAKRIRCKNVHFIRGNHDKAKVGKMFKSTEDTTILKVKHNDEPIKIFLSHYPHAYWPASHYGSLHLYGHCHTNREETLNELFPGRRSMDVGVDNARLILGEYRPFSLDEVLNILLPRPGHDPVEWYREKYGEM